MALVKKDFIDLLNRFPAMTLVDLDRVSLQDRMDTKFVFPETLLPHILEELIRAGYGILQINDCRAFGYSSTYYDTDAYDLYRRHACGKLNRYKVRLRRYVDTNTSYFEVKFKNNRGRTLKSRVKLNKGQDDSASNQLVAESTPYQLSNLHPGLIVDFNRLTLVSPDFKERLTLDMDLAYKLSEKQWQVDGLVIAELKQNRAETSFFSHLMKRCHVRPSPLSKYCLGMSKLAEGVKSNNFKPQILMVKKIQHAATRP
ncbi:MAG: polyphosphate polymerase domain-containing protein [Bacteroidota bacterium]